MFRSPRPMRDSSWVQKNTGVWPFSSSKAQGSMKFLGASHLTLASFINYTSPGVPLWCARRPDTQYNCAIPQSIFHIVVRVRGLLASKTVHQENVRGQMRRRSHQGNYANCALHSETKGLCQNKCPIYAIFFSKE